MPIDFRIKRIYDEPNKADGMRLLVDRLWPRGVSKEAAQIDQWTKVLTPSTELRKWFHEDPARHQEFVKKFTAELEGRREEIETLVRSLEQQSVVTLVTSTKDLVGGHVAVVKQFVEHLKAGEDD
jgi:uncharacterized protein YeaO (DUF488 family)